MKPGLWFFWTSSLQFMNKNHMNSSELQILQQSRCSHVKGRWTIHRLSVWQVSSKGNCWIPRNSPYIPFFKSGYRWNFAQILETAIFVWFYLRKMLIHKEFFFWYASLYECNCGNLWWSIYSWFGKRDCIWSPPWKEISNIQMVQKMIIESKLQSNCTVDFVKSLVAFSENLNLTENDF